MTEHVGMHEDLVTVARFVTAWEAELMRGQLAAEGIESVLADVEAATLRSALAHWAAVKLQVRERDVPAALRLIAERDAAPHDEREHCLACGAPLAEKATRCAACGWTWESAEPAG
jgi:Putative prokaryotic signal transducing protein